jgi:oligoendopeptidase F
MAMTDEAKDVLWDLEPLVYDKGTDGVDELLDQADELAVELAKARGQLASFDSDRLAAYMNRLGELQDVTGRAGNYAQLRYSADTNDPANGALVQRVQERSTAIGTKLLFFDLEWAALPDDKVRELVAPSEMDPYRHHLLSARRYRDYLLTEPEEKIMTEKAVSGRSAWTRLFSELTSALEVDVEGEKKPLEEGLSLLSSPDRDVRRKAAAAITESFEPGLKTRAYLFNTILSDKAIDDRLRGYEHWLKSRNLANEASDESVEALVSAVRDRYDIPRRWYKLKARIWGIDRIADYDRVASLAQTDERIGFKDAKRIVLDSYGSFSSELADLARRFFDESWIDAPVRPGKRPGAFCAYTVPSHHPYVFLNYTSRRTDVLTMAH